MRITELLEGIDFDDADFVDNKGDKREINYDIPDDLMHFMHNDDEVYRRHLYPCIAKCLECVKSKKPTNSNTFKPAVEKSYKVYAEKFPIRELPRVLDEKMTERICNKLHDEFKEHMSDGKYKD